MGIATALVVDGATYLIGCGRAATTQYMRAGLGFDGLQAVFLTHLHADHVSDYYNLFLLAGGLPNSRDDVITTAIPVYGPGPAGALPPKYGGGQAPTRRLCPPRRARPAGPTVHACGPAGSTARPTVCPPPPCRRSSARSTCAVVTHRHPRCTRTVPYSRIVARRLTPKPPPRHR
ncbi:MBL fold metallo-hydrolase [Streptomyces coelicoflavus]|uniref:MBL fold metallo-hydrolase n=1 Tax=Streptomyces coelicoflavus TaxID=285562 RepID=UPI0036CA2DFC